MHACKRALRITQGNMHARVCVSIGVSPAPRHAEKQGKDHSWGLIDREVQKEAENAWVRLRAVTPMAGRSAGMSTRLQPRPPSVCEKSPWASQPLAAIAVKNISRR
jgi:hypothetical protein